MDLAKKLAQAKNYGMRVDGTPKGRGYFGEVPNNKGGFSTELSVDVDFDGKKTLIPLMVPTLTRDELNYIVNGGQPTKAIMNKAVGHAVERMRNGQSPFAD